MKKSRFESELSSLDKLMQQDLKKKERKQIVERLRDLIDRVDKYADRGKIPKEAALRIRIDLLYLVKQVKNEGENARVSIRNARREAKDEYKNMQKDGLSEDETKSAEDDIQKLTDEFTEKVEKIVEAKDQDIMTI